MMRRAHTEEWVAMVQQFEALGQEADSLLDENSPRLALLLEERDALLARLSADIAANPPLSGERLAVAPLAEAMQLACSGTSTLIGKVAERTDALRTALRDLSRGARASQAYLPTGDTQGRVNARR